MDLKIKSDEYEFHVRTCGIIKQNDKFLIMRVNKSDYYHIPGGHVEIGETSEDGVIREIKEEIGCDISSVKLFAIQENFWSRNDRQCHGIEFYYLIEPVEQLEQENCEKVEIDKGVEKLLELKWVTVNELKDIDLKPANIKRLLIEGKYLEGTCHLINKDNRN